MHSNPAILLAFSNAARRSELASKLQSAGFEVVAVESAKAALAAFDERIDIVLTDFALGESKGSELAIELKERAAGGGFLPVLLFGPDDPELRAHSFLMGCDDFLQDTIPFFELEARIRARFAYRALYSRLEREKQELRDEQGKKRELVTLAVHDFRNPLCALEGYLEFLRAEVEPDPGSRIASIFEHCNELVHKLLVMCGGLLDVEELERGLLVVHPVQVSLAKFVRETERFYRLPVELRELKVECVVEPDLTAVFDKDLIGRVLENLFNNAVRYAPFQGKIRVSAVIDGDFLYIRMGNNGPTIPKDERERIFDRYYRIDSQRRAGAEAGRGLGLYFCSLVAQAHGGTITFEEFEGLPACFVLCLPQVSGDRLRR